MSAKKTESPKPSFEQDLAELEALVNRMEAGDMSLEDALAAFENGVQLTRRCQQALQQAELRIQQLSHPDGDPETFDTPPTDLAGTTDND